MSAWGALRYMRRRGLRRWLDIAHYGRDSIMIPPSRRQWRRTRRRLEAGEIPMANLDRRNVLPREDP